MASAWGFLVEEKNSTRADARENRGYGPDCETLVCETCLDFQILDLRHLPSEGTRVPGDVVLASHTTARRAHARRPRRARGPEPSPSPPRASLIVVTRARDRAASRARARSEARPRLVPSESRADARRARGALAPSRGPALGATPRARRHAALVRPPKPRHARGSRGRHPDGHRRQKRRRPRRAGPRQPGARHPRSPTRRRHQHPTRGRHRLRRALVRRPRRRTQRRRPRARRRATAGNAEATSPTAWSSASPAYSSSTPNPDHVRDDAARAAPAARRPSARPP